MSLIANCLAKLVKAGKITQKQADTALVLQETLTEELVKTMPLPAAEGRAALEAARIMGEAAKAKKLQAARNLVATHRGETRQANHPKGRTAGLMGILTRDVWEKGGKNVETITEVVERVLYDRFGDGLESMSSKISSPRNKQQMATARNMIRELFGEDTGEQVAKASAKGWKDATEYGVKRYKAGGGMLRELGNWRAPQFWEAKRVGRVNAAAFTRELKEAIDRGGLTILDRETGKAANPGKHTEIIQQFIKDVKGGKGTKGAHGFQNKMRVFQFNDADTWLQFMGKYGPGDHLFGTLQGYLNSMAREIALTEIIGPSHASIMRKWLDEARSYEKSKYHDLTKTGKAKKIIARPFSSVGVADKTYRYLTGELNGVKYEWMAGIGGALRNLQAASKLGSAVIAAVPGDSVTAFLAANHVGMNGFKVISRTIKMLADNGPEGRRIAARMRVTSHAVMDSALMSKRFEDQIVGDRILGRQASFVIRATGLQAWTEMLKRAFEMEFLGFAAEQALKRFDDMDPAFLRFLERFDISADEFAQIGRRQMDVEGARFIDLANIEDREIADKFLGAIIDERQFAVMEPTARVMQMATGGLQRGEFFGEVARSTLLFKSFSISLLVTHGMRIFTQGDPAERVWRGVSFVTLMTLAGAASLQAKQIIAGKDPRDMGKGDFWKEAIYQGGGAGIYGDLIRSTTSRSGNSFVSDLAGPVAGFVESSVKTANKLISPSEKGMTRGEAATNYLRRETPGTNAWYARLAIDRLIWDQLQMYVDPQYSRSWARKQKRMRREYDQEDWWQRGELSPERGPDLSGMFGG